MKILRVLSLFLSLGLAACGVGKKQIWSETPEGGLQVVASFSILADLAEQVGDGRLAVRTLVPREGDPHTFEPTPANSRNLIDADLLFEIGNGFEPWMNSLIHASGSPVRRVNLTTGLDLLPFPSSNDGHNHGEHNHRDHHDHGERDPHVWHDVRNVQKMVESIRDVLSEEDPEGAEQYAGNAAVFLKQLEELDEWILNRIQEIPPEKRKLVTGHDVFRYFVARYGFERIGTALGGLSTEIADPSASAMGELVQRIRSSGVNVVFPEAGFNSLVLEQIAREAGVNVAPPLYTDSLSRKDGPADTYIRLMRHNVETLVTHLTD